MAIQSALPLRVGEDTNFSLDLSQPHALIPVSGKVVWSDASGRTGVEFTFVDAQSLDLVKQWLLANSTPADKPPTSHEERGISSLSNQLPGAAAADYTSLLAGAAAVKKEVEALGIDLDAALHLVARRAQSFTAASGAAIGLSDADGITCRATAGPDAPAPGARIRAGLGFSGECVRTGKTLRCDDAETDSRVDQESCRALGIRSMLAVPIRSHGIVVGLLEVFAPHSHTFSADHEAVLGRLTEIVACAVRNAEIPTLKSDSGVKPVVDDEFPVETTADLPIPQISHSRNLLLVGAAVTLIFATAWIVGTWNSSGKTVSAGRTRPKPVSQASASTPVPASLDAIMKIAEQGDSAAQFAVGAHYAAGEDVSQDYAEAFRWFSLAAEQNYPAAQSALGGFYWAGRGTPMDLSKAYFWSLLAESGGDEAAKQRVALLASRLTRNQIVAAQQQANEWLQEHASSDQKIQTPGQD